jgi:hypothetical protein
MKKGTCSTKHPVASLAFGYRSFMANRGLTFQQRINILTLKDVELGFVFELYNAHVPNSCSLLTYRPLSFVDCFVIGLCLLFLFFFLPFHRYYALRSIQSSKTSRVLL